MPLLASDDFMARRQCRGHYYRPIASNMWRILFLAIHLEGRHMMKTSLLGRRFKWLVKYATESRHALMWRHRAKAFGLISARRVSKPQRGRGL